MISKKLKDITASDLQLLVDNNVLEKRNLEYKSKLPENSDLEKKEFLADVSSFANTEGGDLIFGICENNGTIEKSIGINIANVDQEIARLENIARDGILPRVALEVTSCEVEGKHVIIVRTKASLHGPHRVVFKSHDKFYRRNSNGKYPMDVDELRVSFLQSSELTEKIRRFRTMRISDLRSADSPVPLSDHSTFIAIHIMPLSAFNSSYRISPKTLLELKTGKHANAFRPLRASGWNYRINLDGFLTYSGGDNKLSYSYTQLYADGKVEAIDNLTLSHQGNAESKEIPMGAVEVICMKYVSKILQLLSDFDIQPPFYVFISLVGIEGYTLTAPTGHHFFDTERERITQENILLPEVVIDDLSDNLPKKFQPVFDMVWNAAGISRSLSYDDDGNYKHDIT